MRRIPPYLFLLLLPSALGASGSIFEQTNKGKCQPIDIEMCKDIPYNTTFHPNPMMHFDQQSLHAQAEHFKPLVRTKCHPHVQFFLCSVFAPMCPPMVPQAVTSCRSVCEQVKESCKALMLEFGFVWPEPLECERFPEEPQLCMKPSEESQDRRQPLPFRPSAHNSLPNCPPDLLNIDPSDKDGACAIQCDGNVMFSREDKKTAATWVVVLGTANLAVASFTFFTYLIDRHRFKFPERCVFFMSFCLAMLSIPHLFPLLWTFEQRACDKIPTGQSYLVYSGFENPRCLLSFTLSYYFASAASLWWLMFAFTWYLSAGRKWVPEGIEACSSYVHLVAWGVSALLTTAVLVTQRVDASELTGLCGAGHLDPQALLLFSFAPRLVLTVLGTLFVIAGLSSMCREGQSFRRRGTDTSKLEKLLAKMGMFCVFYIVPAATVAVCDYLHYADLEQWSRATVQCKRFGGFESGKCSRPAPLQSARHLLSLFMSLAGGAACALWILSPKTFVSWQRFLCCGLCSPAPQKSSSSHFISARPLLEPPVPVAPPPQPPTHYAPLHSGHVWRPSNVV